MIPRLPPEIRALVSLGLVHAEPVSIGPSGPDLLQEIEATCRSLALEHAGRSSGEIPGVAPARELYRAFGVDPTKTRPSSEALLRRVLSGKPFPHISNAVDLVNLFALRFLLSLGLYDAKKIQGAVTLRRGDPSESFKGIGKDQVHLDGRLVLADELGAFGNPTSDSLRTSVTQGTRSLWMVIFAPASYSKDRLQVRVEEACRDMIRHLSPHGEPAETHGLVVP